MEQELQQTQAKVSLTDDLNLTCSPAVHWRLVSHLYTITTRLSKYCKCLNLMLTTPTRRALFYFPFDDQCMLRGVWKVFCTFQILR